MLHLIILRHTTLGRTTVDLAEASDNTQHSQQISMFPAGCKPATPPSELPQTHTFDHAATGIGQSTNYAV